MSTASAPPPTERAQTLERLIGVRSSKPSFYEAWRENSARLDRSVETLERISAALCAAPEGPEALCAAVVEAAAHHFDAPWAAMAFTGERDTTHVAPRRGGQPAAAPEPVPVTWPVLSSVSSRPEAVLGLVCRRALAAAGPVVLGAAELGSDAPADAAGGVVAAPMPVQGELVGVLAVGLRSAAVVQATDMSILVILANHAGVATHNAQLFAQSERVRLRLEEAGRRQLLSQERNRIARELHDSVAQHLLTIGMNLEWCRRHDSTSPPVRARVTVAKSLARSAVDEIRAVIFELASDGKTDLRCALQDVIEDVVAGTRLRVALRTYGETQPLPGALQHALVQIAREALFNVVRHADADHAWLTVRWSEQWVRLVVSDDGRGDVGAIRRGLEASRPARAHFGLAGIGARARELSGTAAVRRRRGGGVKVVVEVPL